ncbi:hypothetical protein A9K55_006128 [Cordyceps militaris]|uniref:Uncharacterized protein n=1 Tax=Cordyceps militaris TaxID=73501 RepID=A0A2H4SAY7_CORMI|nr:hypothetical protein A9K55_006128 [Cordyceps militaris]
MSDNHNVASSRLTKGIRSFGTLAPHAMYFNVKKPVQSTSFPYSPPYVHIEACLETATKACPAQPPVHNLVTQLGS